MSHNPHPPRMNEYGEPTRRNVEDFEICSQKSETWGLDLERHFCHAQV